MGSVYGQLGGIVYTEIHNPTYDILYVESKSDRFLTGRGQLYLGGSAELGAYFYEDSKNWNWACIGASLTPMKVGEGVSVNFFNVLNAELQGGVGYGIGGGGQIGVIWDNNKIGVGLGGEFFPVFGVRERLKYGLNFNEKWLSEYKGSRRISYMVNIFIFLFMTIPVIGTTVIGVYHIMRGFQWNSAINKDEVKKGAKLMAGAFIYAILSMVILLQYLNR